MTFLSVCFISFLSLGKFQMRPTAAVALPPTGSPETQCPSLLSLARRLPAVYSPSIPTTSSPTEPAVFMLHLRNVRSQFNNII
jgi:hypothetical protein